MNQIRFGPTDPQELYARASAQMAEALPGWTDDYPSDPAVAILELFALLSSAQEIALDRVTGQHYRAYLRLLGGREHTRQPARLLAAPMAPVARGQRFLIGGLPFEVETVPPHRNQVFSFSVITNGVPARAEHGTAVRLEGDWQIEVQLAAPLAAGEKTMLWCGILPEPGRVPPEPDTPAPFRLRGQIFHHGSWAEMEVADHTCGFLKNGLLELTPTACGERLRLRPDGETEGVPCLSILTAEPAVLVQQRTRSAVADLPPPFRLPDGWEGQRVLHFFLPAEGGWREADGLYPENGCITGFREAIPAVLRVCASEPDFRLYYDLNAVAMEKIELENETGILPESLRLMAESGGVWKELPVCIPEEGRTLTAGCRWDEETGVLCFGDGRDFRIPEEGRLMVSACACTEGASANGAGGCIGDGTILAAVCPASGGQDAETAKAAFFRTAEMLNAPLRAVTCADCEALARQTPGLLLERVRAVTRKALGGRGAGFVILAKPVGKPGLTEWQKERLAEWMDRFRLIGVPVEIRSPRLMPLEITVSLSADGAASRQALHKIIQESVDGLQGSADFGAVVSRARLHAALGAAPYVQQVHSLTVRTLAPGAEENAEEEIHLQPDTLPYIKSLKIM